MRILVTIAFLFPFLAFGQPFGNEWLDFDQEYFKIMVPEHGIYQIGYDDLQAAGFPLSGLNPELLQIFRRGREVAVHVEDQGDGSFDQGDYLLFYGQKNDGQLDEELYVAPDAQPHQYLSLYADSAAYLLTVGSVPGKRMGTLPAFSGPTPDNWMEQDIISILQSEYAPGITEGESTQLSQFDYGEGFTGPRATEQSRPNRDIDISGLDFSNPTGPAPNLELIVVGRNNEQHNYEVLVGPDANNLVSIGVFQIEGYKHQSIATNIAWSNISATGSLKIRVSVIDDGNARSSISISAAKLNYARLTNADNAAHLEVNTVTKLSGGNSIVFTNTASTAGAYDITDSENVNRLADGDADPNQITIGFADATTSKKVAIAEVKTSFSIQKARIRPLDPTQHNYLIISHPQIMLDSNNVEVVKQYAAYRASPAGGSYDTLVVDINMLYNQFSYGQPTPVAIYRFMKYMTGLGDPQYLFIIGKGLDLTLKFFKSTNWPAGRPRRDFIPTAGYPGSDLVYTVGLGNEPNSYSIPVGRLSIFNAFEVTNYLNKVKEMEALDYDALWRKNLLHLSGGNNLNEIEKFRAYIDGFANIARGPFLGGEVKTKSKQTTNSVEQIDVSTEVNQGVNIITFFGHSSPNTTDIDIGFVSDPRFGYENKGKYPLILMNGCNTGNIYGNNALFSEDWMQTANKGATGVIAHSSYGSPPFLRIWSQFFYQLAYGDSVFIERPVGDIMTETSKRMIGLVGPEPNIYFKTQVQQMGLQGDPAVKLFGTYLPDYEIAKDNIEFLSFNGGEITAEEDSFAIVFGVRNFGAFVTDSLEIAVRRTLPDLSIATLDTLVFPPVRYFDTLQIVFDNRDLEAAGINRFDIVLDPLNKLPEHDDLSNNSASVDKVIKTAGTLNLLPYNFQLQGNDSVTLLIQPGDQLLESRSFSIEIDTTADFSSNAFPPFEKAGSKLIAVDNLKLFNEDTATYYWRSRYTDPGENESAEWMQSSFSVISGASQGWAQLEFAQQIENNLNDLKINNAEKKIDFLNSSISVELRVPGISSDTIYYLPPSVIVRDAQLNINGVNYLYFVNRFQPFTYCYYNRLNIVAIDKESSVPYAPIFGNQVDQWVCGLAPEIINSYPNGNRVSLDSMINAVDSGDKVLIFTVGSFDFNSLSPTTLSKLEDLGANPGVLLAKDPGAPYILVGTKGAGTGNSIAEIVADPASGVPADEQTITYSGELTGTYAHGSIITNQLGPANDWQTLYLNVKTPGLADRYELSVEGYNLKGQVTPLLTNITEPLTDLSSIDAANYPYLKLRLDLEDTVDLTAPQLDNWIINYAPAAEGVLFFDSLNLSTARHLELKEGEDSVRLRFSFVNVAATEFSSDSLMVYYSSFNNPTRTTMLGLDSLSIRAPLPGQSTPILINFDPKGMIGTNDFSVSVNPFLEPEQSFANNRLNLPDYLTIIRENTNPVLDVSFDGVYIFDGDIVSPNPNIAIVIRDENPYLLKADTTGISILLKRPCETCGFERVALSGSNIVWTPENEKDPFNIDFTPKDLEDGIYELQVQVEDASGNLSGTEPYKISFEVINESTVTNFYPYPNPFSTSVKFIFTLTGNELPDELMIRIMTVSGRVVKEIHQEELGLLRIGNNVTDYAWDGRDEFGDQLANGVYLYKVYMRQNGQNIELRPSSGDRGFKNGYGKLYLLR